MLKAHRDGAGTLTDLEWRSANPAAERLLGAAPLVGRRLRGGGTEADCPGLFSALTDAVNGPVERTIPARRGATRVRWRVVAGPAPDGVCAVLTDLGPEAPAEAGALAESLTAALEHSGESFALFDHEDRLVHANSRLKRDLPDLADRLVPGVPFEELVRCFALTDPRLTTDEARGSWMAARLERHRRLEPPVVVPLADGRWLLSRDHAVPGGVLVHYTDVTTLKLNEERLRIREAEARAARVEAESASRAKSAFLAQMSHELRTPLNAVLGFSEMLLSEALGPLGNPRYRSYASDIRDAGTHLLALIDDILELSRLEGGGIPMAEEGVDLDSLSLRVVSALQEVAKEGDVHVRREVPANLPLLQGDASALTQMLTNLLSNAVTHTRPGGEVVLTAHQMPDGAIGLMVADTGVGIATAELPRILAPFEQQDSSIARNSRGTGLGLPIVKRLVEMHGGRLELTSQPGVGTAVVLIFPAERSLPRDRCRPAPLPPVILPR
ncbi:PAS domain-containing sensor histidine kinase [Azospirillum sp. B506]|uniref:PAS domain-containing sensor histidine kinase n=1 Tax=Azospirillum sp. B506 TaxID=137721 RepID=UPI001FCBAD21|nr:PAS domain-containing sensor histidine kinase [Azospirillum sp. B506]